MRLKGKVAIVTGGGRGIGKAISLMLAKEGCNLAIAGRDAKNLRLCESEIQKAGASCLAVKCDLNSTACIKKLVAETLRRFRGIDILVNNAGVAYRRLVVDTTEEELDETLNVNLRAPFLLCKYAVPQMLKQGSGVIVNISSGAGRHGFPELGAYCASKFGVIGLTESLAREVSRKGIRVYAVCPGGVATDMFRSLFPEEYDPRKLLSPEDVAAKVVELCKDRSAPTGKCYPVYKLLPTLKLLRKLRKEL